MKRPSKNAPNRFAQDKHHALYGIWNFLNTKGIMDGKDMEDLILAFLYEQKYVDTNIEKERYRNKFIQNNFGKFSRFVKEYTKPLSKKDIKYSETNILLNKNLTNEQH